MQAEAKPDDVESLRREATLIGFPCGKLLGSWEARDTLLKAARDGRLATAFAEVKKAGKWSQPEMGTDLGRVYTAGLGRVRRVPETLRGKVTVFGTFTGSSKRFRGTLQ